MYWIASFPSIYLRLNLFAAMKYFIDRNPIFYSFSRLIAILANTNAHIYAREEQILAIRMIALEE